MVGINVAFAPAAGAVLIKRRRLGSSSVLICGGGSRREREGGKLEEAEEEKLKHGLEYLWFKWLTDTNVGFKPSGVKDRERVNVTPFSVQITDK